MTPVEKFQVSVVVICFIGGAFSTLYHACEDMQDKNTLGFVGNICTGFALLWSIIKIAGGG